MHHGPAQKTTSHLAPCANRCAHRQRLLLRWVKAEKAQHAGVRPIVHRDQQLAAATELNFTLGHHAFDLHRVALARIAQAGDAGFILIPQRQMQGQVDVAAQAQLVHGLLGGGFSLAFSRTWG